MAARRAPVLKRRIYFFALDVGSNEDGPHIFPFRPVFRHVSTLPWQAGDFSTGSRYRREPDGREIGCWVEDHRSVPCCVKLATLRRRDRPPTERGGHLGRLQLPSASGLAEVTHMVVFDGNVLGAEFNFYGPRATALAHYLNEKASRQLPGTLEVLPLLRRDAEARLASLDHLELVRMKLRAGYSLAISQSDASLGRALRALQEASGDDAYELEIALRSKRKSRLPDRLKTTLKNLLRMEETYQQMDKLVAKGPSLKRGAERSRMTELDLLADKLSVQKELARESADTKSAEDGAAWSAIQEAYDELQREIEEAAALRLAEQEE